jgi:hypothetical protein
VTLKLIYKLITEIFLKVVLNTITPLGIEIELTYIIGITGQFFE